MIEISINVREREDGHKPIRISAKAFDNVAISLRFDSVVSTFKFDLDFDPTNPDHAELMCPTHMHECVVKYVYENGAVQNLISGFMLSQGFANSNKPELSSIGGYSRPGLLQDCDIPIDCPQESNGLTFRQVVQRVLDSLNSVRKATINNPLKFKINSSRADQFLTDVDKRSSDGLSDSLDLRAIIEKVTQKSDTVIPKTTAQESTNALSYLKNIAIQKRLVLSHDGDGNLIVGIPNTNGKPLFEADFSQYGKFGITDARLIYDGQHSHSHITVIRQADKDGGNAAEYTITNPLCPIVYRPRVVTLSFGDDITIEQAARAELGNDLRCAVLKITLDRWEIDGKLIVPNNTIVVRDPKLYLYKKTVFFIEAVDLLENTDRKEAVLTCVLKSVYDDSTPINPFVEPGANTPLN